jgi:hypothetical protein
MNAEISCEIDGVWVPYYAELEPGKRLEILNSLTEDDSDFRHVLYRERYQDAKHPSRSVDNWLWKCVYLPGLYRRGFFKGAARREMLATLSELHLPWDNLNDEDRAALYWEFRNTARRYLSTCRSDGYGNSFFGLKRASEEEKKQRACRDIWTMSRGVALCHGLESEMLPWCRALRDELDEAGLDYESYGLSF